MLAVNFTLISYLQSSNLQHSIFI